MARAHGPVGGIPSAHQRPYRASTSAVSSLFRVGSSARWLGWVAFLRTRWERQERKKLQIPAAGECPARPWTGGISGTGFPATGKHPARPLAVEARDGGLVVTAFGSRRRRHDLILMGGDQNARGTSGMARHGVGTRLQTAGTPGGSAMTIGTGKESCPIERERFCHGSSELFFRSPWFGAERQKKPVFLKDRAQHA